jgi:hypothetical protein
LPVASSTGTASLARRRVRTATVRCLIVLGLVLTTSLSVAIIFAIRGAEGPVYSVGELRANLTRRPAAWLGRTVWVQGLAVASGCQTWPAPEGAECQDWRQGIADPRRVEVLPLAAGAPNLVLALLRRVPLLSTAVPPPQQLRWDALTTYRVQVHPASASSCSILPCYEVVLLDALP